MHLSVGQQVLDRYVVELYLGKGGMGEVYRARHARLGMPVALKVFTGAEPELIKRFEREAELMARVRHPNVVSIVDYGLAGGAPCIAMEFVEGELLEDRLSRRRALPLNESLEIIYAVLAGLDAIHAASVLHRDLKPLNVIIARGTPEVVKVFDFGIAKAMDPVNPRLTRTGVVVGTPAYMSPEQQLSNPLDPRSDVYAAALVLYELLSGALPFGADAAPLRRIYEPIPPPAAPIAYPSIPEAISAVILQALSRAPEQRPGTAGAFARALKSAMAQNDSRIERLSLPNERVTIPNPIPRRASSPEGASGIASPAYGVSPVRVRCVLATRLPRAKHARPEERSWLTDQLPEGAKGIFYGEEFWFALFAAGTDADAFAAANQVSKALKLKYGESALAVLTPVDEGFPAATAIEPTAPFKNLPPAIQRLIDRLSEA